MTMTDGTAAGTAAPRVEFRATGGLGAWLESRRERTVLARDRDGGGTALGMQARLELALWRDVLAAELAAMPPIPLAWADALTEVTGGEQMSAAIAAVRPDGSHYPVLWAEWSVRRADIAGHPGNTFAARYGLDEDKLDSWLKSLSPARDHAVRDALSRWWAEVYPSGSFQMRDWQSIDQGTGLDPVSVEGLAAVGLRVTA